jgi:hypothetical protein
MQQKRKDIISLWQDPEGHWMWRVNLGPYERVTPEVIQRYDWIKRHIERNTPKK